MISVLIVILTISAFFFFNDTATTEIYTLSLHDALPISAFPQAHKVHSRHVAAARCSGRPRPGGARRRSCDQAPRAAANRSEEHTSELQSPDHLVCRLLLEKKKHTPSAKPR